MDIITIASVKHASTVINGLTSQSLNNNLEQMLLTGSGMVDPTFVGVGKIRPELSFTTTAIKTALANLGGIDGIIIAASNFTFWLQYADSGGTRKSGTNHYKCDVVAGMVIPQRIRAVHAQPATIEYLVVILSADGTTSPITFTASSALDVGQAGAAEAYTMGVASLNSSQLEGLSEWELDFGIVHLTTEADGLVYPIHSYINTRQPKLTLTTYSVDTLATWGLDGQAQDANDSTVQLDDVSEGGVRGSAPITFTFDEGMQHFESINGSDGERIGGSVILTPTYDGTDNIVAISGLV